MDVRQLEFFLAVVDERSFTKAAEKVFVTQSGSSASIRALERELGVRLFDRGPQGATPTKTGDVFFPRARRMLADARAAQRELLEVSQRETRLVRVGSEQCVGDLVDLVDLMATIGIGLAPTILPTTGKPSFELPDGEMEIGIGIHGEPGTRRGALETADEIAEHLTAALVEDLGLGKGSRVAVLVNGMGATPLEELYVLYRKTHKFLAERGIEIVKNYVGEYATSLEMAGASISLLELNDDRLELLNAPARSPFFREG